MLFSIIIPAKNEEKMMVGCLEHLARLDFPRQEYEVVLADNGSMDRTVEIFRSWSDRLTLSVVEKSGVNISAMRNAGVAACHGELLAFLDADCLAPRNWLNSAARLLEAPNAGIIGAHYRIPSDSTWVARCWFAGRNANRTGQTSYLPAGDLLMSRLTFNHLRGFDETLQTNEDYEICQRARRAGYAVRSYPELEVIHLGTPQTISGFYKKHKWHGLHVFQVFVAHWPSLYNARVVFFALYTLLGLLLVICGAVAILIGKASWLFPSSIAFALFGFVFLAGRAAVQQKTISIFAPLVLLYLLYGIARASCMFETLIATTVGRGRALGKNRVARTG